MESDTNYTSLQTGFCCAGTFSNRNADAIIAVYPFTPQPAISQAVIGISDVPVFVGVGGGITGGDRSVRLAIEAENQGAFGVVVNAPISNEVISRIKEVADIPVIATIVSDQMDIRSRIEAGLIFSMCPARRRRRRSCAASVRSFRTFRFLQPEDRTMKRSWRPSTRCKRDRLLSAQQWRTFFCDHAKIPRKTINIAFESCREYTGSLRLSKNHEKELEDRAAGEE